jgi:hypothetical protein
MRKLTRRTFVTGSAALLWAPAAKTKAQSSWPALRDLGVKPSE